MFNIDITHFDSKFLQLLLQAQTLRSPGSALSCVGSPWSAVTYWDMYYTGYRGGPLVLRRTVFTVRLSLYFHHTSIVKTKNVSGKYYINIFNNFLWLRVYVCHFCSRFMVPPFMLLQSQMSSQNYINSTEDVIMMTVLYTLKYRHSDTRSCIRKNVYRPIVFYIDTKNISISKYFFHWVFILRCLGKHYVSFYVHKVQDDVLYVENNINILCYKGIFIDVDILLLMLMYFLLMLIFFT